LVDSSNQVIQFLSYEGSFTAVGGPADGITSTDIGVAEGSDTPVGDSLQLSGTGSTYADFTWTGPEPSTLGANNTNQIFGDGTATTNPSGTGAADPKVVNPGDITLLTVAVSPGENPASTELAVSCDLSPIGGSTDQVFFDDGSNGDAAGNDNTFSYLATLDAGTANGGQTLNCTVTDAQARSRGQFSGIDRARPHL
jgi:hypothetical protein